MRFPWQPRPEQLGGPTGSRERRDPNIHVAPNQAPADAELLISDIAPLISSEAAPIIDNRLTAFLYSLKMGGFVDDADLEMLMESVDQPVEGYVLNDQERAVMPRRVASRILEGIKPSYG